MGLLGRLFGRRGADEAKSVDISPELWAAINGGWGLATRSGQSVSLNASLQVTAFYRAILVIAEGIAQLPIEVYRSAPSGRGVEPATDHPLYYLLKHRASEWQDAFQFWRTVLMHAAGAGNSVSYRVVVNGETKELLPVRPDCVQIDLDAISRQIFRLTFEGGQGTTVFKDDVFHLPGPSWSPYKGLDPSVVGREAIGLARATEEVHASLHANGARPSGVLTTTARLNEGDVLRLREQWQKVYAGSGKTGETAILGSGLDWKAISQNGVDSQHIDTRKLQIEEIARLLGVFPIMLGHSGDQTPTFASADAFLEAHVRYTLQPWIKAVIAAVETQLLTKDEILAGYHVRIDSSELLRGSLKDRTDYYKAALGTNSSPGWLSVNEIREDDGWENTLDGENFDRPVTAQDYVAPKAEPKPADPAVPDPAPPEAKSSTPRTLYVSRKLLNGAELLRWARGQGFKTTLAVDDLHVTVAYSRAKVDWMAINEGWDGDGKGHLAIQPGGPRVVEKLGDKGAIVLKFNSSALRWRNEQIRECGASWDWPEYQPHVTITYDGAGVDLTKVEPFAGALKFGPEIFAEIDHIADIGSGIG